MRQMFLLETDDLDKMRRGASIVIGQGETQIILGLARSIDLNNTGNTNGSGHASDERVPTRPLHKLKSRRWTCPECGAESARANQRRHLRGHKLSKSRINAILAADPLSSTSTIAKNTGKAKAWLDSFLTPGATMTVNDILEAARRQQIPISPLRRAREELRIAHRRADAGHWVWERAA